MSSYIVAPHYESPPLIDIEEENYVSVLVRECRKVIALIAHRLRWQWQRTNHALSRVAHCEGWLCQKTGGGNKRADE